MIKICGTRRGVHIIYSILGSAGYKKYNQMKPDWPGFPGLD